MFVEINVEKNPCMLALKTYFQCSVVVLLSVSSVFFCLYLIILLPASISEETVMFLLRFGIGDGGQNLHIFCRFILNSRPKRKT